MGSEARAIPLSILFACVAVATVATPAASYASVSFSPAPGSPYYVGNQSCGTEGHRCGNVYGVPTGDLDRDGRLDVAASVSPTSVLPLLGSGGGQLSFGSDHMYARAGTFSRFGAAVADFNADAHPDVVTSLGSGSPALGSGFRSVAVMLGDGAGGFTTASRVDPGGEAPEGLAVGDLNGDGHEDVAVANFATDNVSILLGNGAGGLAPAPGSPIAVGDGPWAVAAADLDNDGDLDLAVVNQTAETISILLGDVGGFSAAPGAPVAVGRGVPRSIAVGDFNEDGNADLTAAGFVAPSGVAVLLGNGAGGFAHAPGSPYGDGNAGSWAVDVGDLNGDGNQDVATANNTANSISVRLGDGAGGLGAPSTHSLVSGQSLPLSDCPRPDSFPITCGARSISIADFDGDGAKDVVAGNWNAFSVSVLLNISNSAPVARDDEYAINEDGAITVAVPEAGVLGNDSDPDGDSLAAALVSAPAHGTLNLHADGTFTYSPEANFSGIDTFTYRASDGAVTSNVATVSITVRPVNDPPRASNDEYATDEDVPLAVPAAGVLGNDTDPDGDPLTTYPLVSGPAHGRLHLNADGSFTYTPDPDFSGTDSFTYLASDGDMFSNGATVTITVRPVNDPPRARDDSFETNEDVPLEVGVPGVLDNDADVDPDALSAVLVSDPAHGTLNLEADGSFSYTPAENYSGEDSFTYEAGDGSAVSDVATVSIAVRPVNDPPVPRDDAYETDEDTLLDVPAPGVVGNDTDQDGDPVTVAGITPPAHGQLSIDADGAFRYRPDPDFAGPDSFRYQLTGALHLSAKVSIAVRPVNDAPLARDDSYETDEDTPLEVGAPGLLENDLDVEGDPFIGLELVAGPAHGALNLQADGSFTYTPQANYSGDDSFSYRVRDGSASSNVATVALTVRPVNQIVFASSRSGNGDIYSMRPSGSVPTRMTSGNAIDAEPVWSPNRTRIAFTSTRDGGNVDVYAMDADGGNVTRLTTTPAIDSTPAWSPDGSRIAFTSERAGGNRDVYVMSAAGGANVTRLTTHAAADDSPAWSPNGTRITFSSERTGGGDIYSMTAAPGSPQTRLTTSPAADRWPAWFGATIAFATNRHGNFEIYTMSETGSAQTRRTHQPGVDITPAWSPDGARLAFATNRHGALNFEIYAMNPDGTGQTRLTTHPGLDALPDW